MKTTYNKENKIYTDKVSNQLLNGGGVMKPNKDCKNCNTWSEYICFECEDIFMKENYSNYFYNDDCEWELKKEVA